jgi:CheY-like chemotaxis protein
MTGLRVLIVDDYPDLAESCAVLLELYGHQTACAHSGNEAKRLAESFKPHVLLLDIELPDISGIEVCRHVRSQPWGKNVSIIAISGYTSAEQRASALAAGCRDHLLKPVTAQALRSAIDDALATAAVG